MKYLIYVCALILSLRVVAQDPIVFQYTVNNGLPSSQCYAVTQDKNGYVWVGTDNGISCYNGRRFTNFTSADGLNPVSIILLSCDRLNRVWFCDVQGNIGYMKDNRVFNILSLDKLLKSHTANNIQVNSLHCDNQLNLWIGTNITLYKIPFSGKYKRAEVFRQSGSNAFLISRKTPDGQWVNSTYFSSRNKNKSINKDFYQSSIVLSDHKKSAQTYTYQFGQSWKISQYSVLRETRSRRKLLLYVNRIYELGSGGKTKVVLESNNSLHNLFEDQEGNILVTQLSGGGVLFFPKGDFSQKPIFLLKGNSVGSVCQDHHGGYWFTSTEKGLFYIPSIAFKTYHFKFPSSEAIDALLKWGDALYIVTNTGKFCSFNYKTGKVITSDLNLKHLNTHNSILYTVENKILFSGLKTVLMNQDMQIVQSRLTGNSYWLKSILFDDIEQDDSGNYIGLSISDLLIKKGKYWEELVLLPFRAYCLQYDKQQKVLLIGAKNGLYQFKNGIIKPIERKRFDNKQITSLYMNDNRHLVVGTRKDGVYYRGKDGEWNHLTTKNGLHSNYCQQISSIKEGVVLLKMQSGLNYFFESAPQIAYKLNGAQGIFNKEINCTQICGNTLFIGTNKGLTSIPIENLFKPEQNKWIHLRKFTINNKQVSGHNHSYGKFTYRFYIDILSFLKNENKKYAYKLKGWDRRFKEGELEYIEYTNLPAGSYELQVTVRGKNGKLKPYKKLISFTIERPYWQTWWFILLCCVAAVICISGIVIWRIRVLNKREATRNDLLRQIAESQVVALRAQMNPHFIFNAINSIQDFVLQNETEDAYSYLSKFARLIRLVMHQSTANFLSLEQEVDWLKIYMDLEQLRFKGKFNFELVVDPELEMEKQLPNMLIQPHLENAIWHGIMPLNGKRIGKVRLSFISEGGKLRVEIEDDGVGRGSLTHRNGHDSKGIRLVSDRLERLSKLENIEFRQEIVDLKNDSGQPTGTLIILYIDLLE